MPTNPDVYVHSTPAATFFVLQYGGFGVDDITISTKAASLASKLKARGENFVEGVFFTGGRMHLWNACDEVARDGFCVLVALMCFKSWSLAEEGGCLSDISQGAESALCPACSRL